VSGVTVAREDIFSDLMTAASSLLRKQIPLSKRAAADAGSASRITQVVQPRKHRCQAMRDSL